MIARLFGDVVDRDGEHLVIDVQGVGYEVAVPGPLLLDAPHGEALCLFIRTVVREDAFLLYGFRTSTERDAFDLLRGISGIGPKVAMALLSTLTVPALARAIAQDDVAALARAPGVGKRTAARLVVELKDKLPSELPLFAAPTPRANPGDPLPLALARLDYRKSEIDAAMADPSVVALAGAAIEQRLSAALKVLMRAP